MNPLVREPIDVLRLIASVSGPGFGAATTFVGSVRRAPEDGPVRAIDYSAYEEMAEAELCRVIAEAKEQWPDVALVAQHRLGPVPVGEASVAVVAGAPHRDQAFDACRYVMEGIKKRVPIWKRELFDDGEERWRDNEGGGQGQQ